MPQTPNRDNGYAVGVDTPLNPPTWNSVLGDVHTRLNDAEAAIASYDSTIDELRLLGLESFNETITPLIEGAQESVETIQAALAEAEDVINELVQGQLPATAITYEGAGEFASLENVQQAIDALISGSGGGGEFSATAMGAVLQGAPLALNANGTVSAVSSSGAAGTTSSSATAGIGASSISDAVGFYDASTNKIVVAFRDSGDGGFLKMIVGTYAAGTITWGSLATIVSASTIGFTLVRTGADAFALAYYRADAVAGQYVLAGTISGTTVTVGSPVLASSSSLATKMALDPTSSRLVIAYSDPSDGSKAKARVATISGTTVTLGAELVVDAGACNNESLRVVALATKIIIIWRVTESTDHKMAVATVSGTSVSIGAIFTHAIAMASNNIAT
ncbi:MAG: hypothetical protein B7Z40_13455, partial [Bosea sp. 12-68-7]